MFSNFNPSASSSSSPFTSITSVTTLHFFLYLLSLLAPWTSAYGAFTLANQTQLALSALSLLNVSENFNLVVADLHQRAYAVSALVDIASLFCAESLVFHASKFSLAMAVLNLASKVALFTTVAGDARNKGAGMVFGGSTGMGGGGGGGGGETYSTLHDGPSPEYRPPPAAQ